MHSVANLGALFSAYGDTASPFFEGLAKAEQANVDTSAKNLEMWLKQKENARQEQELALRNRQMELAAQQQQFTLDQLKRQQAAEEVAYSPENIQKLEPHQAEEVSGERSHLGPMQYPMAPPTVANPLANKLLMEAWTKRWGSSEKIEQAAMDRQMREELRKVDFTDPEKAQQEIRAIYMKYADNPEKALAAIKLTPYEEKIRDREKSFVEAAPVYQARLEAMQANPEDRPYVAEYQAALSTRNPELIGKAEENILKRKERAISITNTEHFRSEQNRIAEERVRENSRLRQDALNEAAKSRDLREVAEVRHNLENELRERMAKRAQMQVELNNQVRLGTDPTKPEVIQIVSDLKSADMDIMDIKNKMRDASRMVNQMTFGNPTGPVIEGAGTPRPVAPLTGVKVRRIQ